MSAIYLVISLLLSLVCHARAGELGGKIVECEPQRVIGARSYWSYRVIDGRMCWYAGRPGKPKSELHWSRSSARVARPGEAETQPESSPVRPSEALSAAPAREEVVRDIQQGNEATTLPAPSNEELMARAADNLLAFTCCWPELEKEKPTPAIAMPPPPLLPVQQERMSVWKLVLIVLTIVGAAFLLPIIPRSMQWLTNNFPK